jgi:hypothetical protein
MKGKVSITIAGNEKLISCFLTDRQLKGLPNGVISLSRCGESAAKILKKN